jgi:hypothetical protein
MMEPFDPPPEAPKTRNSEVLASFVAYCQANPGLRFWQALLNWSKVGFILASNYSPLYIEATQVPDGDTVKLTDTYYWEGRNR